MQTPNFIRELQAELEADWPARLARIPDWHPRNEGPAGAPPAAATADPGAAGPAAPPAADPAPAAAATPPEAEPAATPAIELPEQLQPYGDRLLPLLEADDQGNTMLGGLLDFYDMAGNENRLDEFESWWERVGDSYGFFDDDDAGPAGGEGDEPQLDELGLPLDAPEWARSLAQRNQELEAKINGTDEQSRIAQQTQAINQRMTALMSEHSIEDDPSVPEEQRASATILRLALPYAQNPETAEQAVDLGVAEYLRLTGSGAAAAITGAGHQTASVASLAGGGGGGGRPGPSLEGGSSDMEPESVASWGDAKRAALARLQNAG